MSGGGLVIRPRSGVSGNRGSTRDTYYRPRSDILSDEVADRRTGRKPAIPMSAGTCGPALRQGLHDLDSHV
jgi:hypothetical protein